MFILHWLQALSSSYTSMRRRHSRLSHRRRASRAAGLERLEDRTLLSATPLGDLYFSTSRTAPDLELPDVGTVDGSDIIHWDGTKFDVMFDGSDVGLGSADIDGVAILNESEVLISFLRATDVPGVGVVDGADIVKFTATQLGETTAGEFSLFFSGSWFGLSEPAGNIDAFELHSDGSLIISVEGSVTLSTGGEPLVAEDADLLRFDPDTPGDYASGTWSMFFDGSDAELTFPSEDIDAVSVSDDGRLFLSTRGSFFVNNFGGGNEDIVEFVPFSLGDDTSGEYVHPLLFNGNEVSEAFFRANLDAIDIRVDESVAVNTPPIAESQNVELDEDTDAVIQLAGNDGDPEFDQTITFSIVDGPQHGILVDFNPQTGEVTYIPDPDHNGGDNFTFAVTDDESIDGEALSSEPAVVHLAIAAVNDAPSNAVPAGEQLGDEDVPLVLHGIAVQDRDADEGDGTMTVMLTVGAGRVTVSHGDAFEGSVVGNGTSSVELTGPIDQINAVFADGVTYLGNPNFHGHDTLEIATNDRGNRGKGGPMVAQDEVDIVIRSAAEQRDALMAQVRDLMNDGTLKRGEGQSLLGKLDFKNPKSAAQRVSAFIKHTEKLIRRGSLTEEEGAALIDAAETLIVGLETDAPPGGGPRFAQQIDQTFSNFDELFNQLNQGNSPSNPPGRGRGRGR